MAVATGIVIGLAAYLMTGLVFAIFFMAAGIGQVDPAAKGSPVGFRLLVLPGAAALWPLLLRRWMRMATGDS